MSSADRALIFFMLKDALLHHKAQAFEDFFTKAAIVLWGADFEPWKPQGQHGDFKCDGYRVSKQCVFQCHAPEHLVRNKLEKKILDDFEGAREKFGIRMRCWIFVHNQTAGLPPTTNVLLHTLRGQNPRINIETWTPDHFISQLLELPETTLRKLFPHLAQGQTLSEDAVDYLAEVVSKHRAPTPQGDVNERPLLNALPLHESLVHLGDQDRDVRLRLLGYTRWYDPASKTEIKRKLKVLGHSENMVESNARRLHEANLIKITENYYLPLDEELCQQAAETIMAEILQELQG